jgi:homoserine kinase
MSPTASQRPQAKTVTVRVPATTANLGPGFDTLGAALSLYNTLTVTLTPPTTPHPPFIQTISRAFYHSANLPPSPFSLKIKTQVPISRGLGSSVTIRLGLLAALNALHHSPLTPEQLLSIVINLEGHPDNAVPALHGGFAAATAHRYASFPIAEPVRFIAFIPDFELETKKARAVLPKKVPLPDAVHNIQHTALITAAFASGSYKALKDLFHDRLHQPYRAKLIPGFDAICQAATDAGALGAYLSGAGSTLMAITIQSPKTIAQAMSTAASKNKLPGRTLILKPDNHGLTFLS